MTTKSTSASRTIPILVVGFAIIALLVVFVVKELNRPVPSPGGTATQDPGATIGPLNDGNGEATADGDETKAIDGSQVTWIGDSVSAGIASDVLRKRFDGITLDVEVNKSFRGLATAIEDLSNSGKLKKVVVIALGVNGIAKKDGMAEVLDAAGPDRQLILVFPSGGSGEQTSDVYKQLAKDNPKRVQTVDWPAAAKKVKDFAPDGVHIGAQGAGVLADAVAPAIQTALSRV